MAPTTDERKPLTAAERRYLLPHGAQKEIAAELGMKKSYVSAVMDGAVRPKTAPARQRLRKARVVIARRLGYPVALAFPEAEQEAAPTMARAS